MTDANEIYMKNQVRALQAKAEREKIRKRYRDERDENTLRAQRAQRTASQIIGLLRAFIPEKCIEDAHEEIIMRAFAMNIELIEVPPECDHLQKAQLERRMLEELAKPIMVTQPDKA